MEAVAGVEEEDIVSTGQQQRLVHRIVQSAVRLRPEHHLMAFRGGAQGVALAVVLEQGEGLVLRCPVDDEVLNGRVLLFLHALEGRAEGVGGVIADGGDGEFDHGVEGCTRGSCRR